MPRAALSHDRFGAALRLLVLAVTLLVAATVPAVAREEIRSFNSTTTLRTDGSVDVVETLIVNVEGSEIRRGIYRDIPTSLVNDDGSRLRSDLAVIDVRRDGAAEPYSVESIGNGFRRIQIGDADVLLPYGVHTYTIHYTMTRMARFFADHDELFWNATGNYWVFPILEATATLNLPAGAVISGTVGYTGVPGSTEQAVTVTQLGANSVVVRTTRPLRPQEGLSVATKFQTGILSPPDSVTGAGYWLSDHRELIFPAVAVLIVLLYNLFAWNAVGRDPARGTIIPLFHPPQGLSPALTHYVANMGFKQSGWTAFTASIFNLGVKGLLRIDKAGKAMQLTATGTTDQILPVGEAGIYDFVRGRGTVTVDKTDGPKLDQKRSEMVSALQSENGEVYFRNNIGYTAAGVVLAAALLGGLVLLDVLDLEFLVIAVVVAVIFGVLFGVLSRGGKVGGIGSKLVVAVWIAIAGFNLFSSGAGAVSGFGLDTGLIAAISIVLIEIIFAMLMRAPTVAGRKLMDEIAGFRMYLDTAEKNRLNYVDRGEPAMTVTRFESILPFAIALGVEKPWSQRFEADLARHAVADAKGGVYAPYWYHGGDWSSGSKGFSSTVSAMAAGMSAAMIAAQPSSSSGSGFSSSGGGSGGGGGGGGGGGW